MKRSMPDRGRDWWATQAAIVAMAFLVLAAGLCVIDAHAHDGLDDRAALDLCLMLVAAMPVALTSGLPLTGLAGASRLVSVRGFWPHVPAPPPRLFS